MEPKEAQVKTSKQANRRPLSTGEQWQQHCKRQKRKSRRRSLLKVIVAVPLGLFILILIGAPLSMS